MEQQLSPNNMPSGTDLNSVQQVVDNTPQDILEPSNTPAETKKSKMNPLLPVVILLLMIILGGSYYVYQEFFNIEEKQESINQEDNNGKVEDEELEDEEMSYIKKEFVITTSSEMDGEVVMNNEIEIPSTWTYSTEKLSAGSMIVECNRYIVTSTDGKLVLSITPECSGWSSSPIANPETNAVGTYTAVGNDGVKTVSVSRLGIDATNYSYVQGTSVDGGSIEYTNIFLVEKHSSVANGTDPIFWGADINVTYTGEEKDKGTYLGMADKIVLSLQIK